MEHDESIAEPLTRGLARYGIVADHVATGAAALAAAPHDMAVLDLDLPGLDLPARAGIDFCRRLRRAGDVPVIMLTARGEEVDRALGPELGADDYLAKPFGVPELVARIRAVGGRVRTAPADDPVRRYGPLAIDTRGRRIHLHGVPIPLAPKEFDLLALLAAAPGAVVDRRHILATVWEPELGPGRTLDFHVASLRRKLGGAGWIENRRGVGFRLVVPA